MTAFGGTWDFNSPDAWSNGDGIRFTLHLMGGGSSFLDIDKEPEDLPPFFWGFATFSSRIHPFQSQRRCC